MKAKKLIAIGLVATMTLGMSTSVFAAPAQYEDYTSAPVFDQFEKEYDVEDNVFHEKGQGWLESGEGANAGVVNVIVPTRAYVQRNYGDPDVLDFGVDPQRLVKGSHQARYEGKIDFSTDALNTGLYFINPKDGDEHQKNWFDNKSVKYVAKNIGTEPVAFYVEATLTGANDFKILDEAPVESETALALSNHLYGATVRVGGQYTTVGDVWSHDSIVAASLEQRTLVASSETFVRDLVGEPGYNMVKPSETATGVFTETEYETIEDCLEKELTNDATGATKTVEEVFELAAAQDTTPGYTAVLEAWKTESTKDVGMFMTLNMETTSENSITPGVLSTTEFTYIKGSTSDAVAKDYAIVEGNKNNYEYGYDPVSRTYKWTMKENREEPFEQVAFWFAGEVTENSEVSSDIAIPSLDCTWKFSESTDPQLNLTEVNDVPVEVMPTVFTEADCDEDGILWLTFDKDIKSVEVSKTGRDDDWFAMPAAYCVTYDNEVAIKLADFETAIKNGRRYVKFVGQNEGIAKFEINHAVTE